MVCIGSVGCSREGGDCITLAGVYCAARSIDVFGLILMTLSALAFVFGVRHDH